MSIPAPVVKVRPRVEPTEIQYYWSPPATSWIAVGYNSDNTVCIANSPDGLTWTASTDNPFSGGYGIGIAWNGSYWVAVGYNSDNTVCIATSSDGLTWTNSTDNPFSGGYGIGIAWNGSYWVAVGYNSDNTVCIATSSDGLTWTNSTDNPFSGGNASGVAWNGSYWVAVGYNGAQTVCIAKSTDGLLWTNATDNPFSGGYGNGIAWNGSYWVAVGENTGQTVSIAKSTDGLLWTNSTDNPFSGAVGLDIAWNSSYWIAVGYNSDNTVCIATSTDGLLWTNSTNNPFAGGYGNGIAWNGSYWVAVGTNTSGTVCIVNSPDGLTWTNATNNPFSGGQGKGIVGIPINHYILECASPSISITTDPTEFTKTVTGLTNLTDYSFTIKTDISGSYSDPVPFRTVHTSSKPLTVATLTKSQSIVDGLLNLTFEWTNPGDYATYYVYGLRAATGTQDSIYTGTYVYSTLSHTFIGLDPVRTYTFNIQRGNDAGYSPKSSITTTATAVFDPTTVPGIHLWVDATDVSGNGDTVADGSVVTTWKDKSGTANNATATTGATLQTDSVGRYLDFQGSSSYDLTTSSWAYNEYYTIFIVDKPLAYDTQYSLVGHTVASTDSFYIQYNSTDGIRLSSQDDDAALGTAFETLTAPVNVWCFTNYGGKTAYWNKQISGKTSTAAAYITDSLLTIGSKEAGSDSYNGRMREILMYSGVMTEDNRALITNYLYNKWFTPPTLIPLVPVENSTVLWLDAADTKTLFQDLSGTVPITGDGSIVKLWKDKSGFGNNIYASASPIYSTIGINSLPAFYTDTAGGTIETNNYLQTGDATLFIVAKAGTPTFSYYFVHDTLNSFGLSAISGISSWHESATTNNNRFVDNMNTFLFYGKMKKSQLLSGTYIDLSGIQYGYTVDTLNMSVATAPIKLNSVDAVYYGEVIYYNRVLTDAEIQQNVAYLSNKWDISIPATIPVSPTIRMDGLQLWLDSSDVYTLFQSGGIVTAWKSKAGHQYTAIAYGSPTVNNGVVFNGSSQYLSLPDGALPTGDYSYYAVTKFTGDSVIVSGGSKDISGQMWVAVGYNTGYTTSIAISYDDLIWGPPSNNPFSGGVSSGVAWNGSYWLAVGFNSGATVCIAKSTDAFLWLPSTSNPFSGGEAFGIAWNDSDSYWVAVGYNTSHSVCIAKSTDGLLWTDASNNPFSGEQARGIAWNGSYWVAVGLNTGSTVCIATSTDGMTWTNATDNPFSGGGGSAVAWNGSYWVAVGLNSGQIVSIAKSTDGLLWTNASNNPFSSGSGSGIAWNGSYWIAVGNNGGSTVCIAKSTDGLTWTASTNNPFSGGQGSGIAWNGSYWTAVGGNPDNTVGIAISTDGLTWLATTNNPFPGARGIGIASGNAPIHNAITTIKAVTVPAGRVGQTLFDYTINGGKTFVAVGNSTVRVAKSTDGLLWLPSTTNPFTIGYGRGIAWNGSYFVTVGVGDTNNIAKSTDGSTWTDVSISPFGGSGNGGYGIAWNSSDSYWVAVGKNTSSTVCIAKSTDGSTWTDASNNPFSGGFGRGIAWNGLTWVAVGNKTSGTVCIATSSDGMTWTDASNNPFSGGNGKGNGIAWNGSYWVAVGTNDGYTVSIAKSTDGMTWTDASNNPFSGGQGYGVAWNGSYWVAVGLNSGSTVCIAKSTDGMTWTDASNNPFSGGEGSGIVWNDYDSYWVAVGANSDSTVCIATSPDGMTWTASSNNPFSSGIGYGIVYAELIQGNTLTDTNVIPGTTTVIVESLYSRNDNGKSLFLSGLTGATDTSFHFQDASNNYIGWDMSGGYMNGTIKELLVYNTKHTTAQRQQVEAYLKSKWYPNPYTPTGTSLWLDAGSTSQFTLSAVNIQSWNDRSGQGNNFTQSASWAQPIYSLDSVTGRYGVQFAANAIANGLASATSPFGATSSWSIFAVKRYDYSTDQASELVNGNVCTAYDISGNTPITFRTGTTYVATPSTSELQFTADLSGNTATVEIHTIPVLTSQVVNSLTYTAYYNGTTSITYPVSEAMTSSAELNIGFTGTLTPDLAGAMRGYIYEIIVYNRTVGTNERQSIEGYLAWKWGIQSSLSTTHPYYLAPP